MSTVLRHGVTVPPARGGRSTRVPQAFSRWGADDHPQARSGEVDPAPRPSGHRGRRAGSISTLGRCSIPRTVATAQRRRLTQSFCLGAGIHHLHDYNDATGLPQRDRAPSAERTRSTSPHSGSAFAPSCSTRTDGPRLHVQRAQVSSSCICTATRCTEGRPRDQGKSVTHLQLPIL